METYFIAMNRSYTVYAPRYHRQLIIITIILLPPYTLYTQLVKQSNFTQQFFTVSSPHSNRWLYWMDVSHQTLEKASVFGNTSTTLVDELRCTWPLTMDSTTHTLYWYDAKECATAESTVLVWLNLTSAVHVYLYNYTFSCSSI